jgi:enolase
LGSEELCDYLLELARKYPIISIEDGMNETDETGFQLLMQNKPDHLQIVGDDLFVTNSALIKQGIEKKSANAVLIKMNQIGTITETIQAIKLTQQSG